MLLRFVEARLKTLEHVRQRDGVKDDSTARLLQRKLATYKLGVDEAAAVNAAIEGTDRTIQSLGAQPPPDERSDEASGEGHVATEESEAVQVAEEAAEDPTPAAACSSLEEP